MLEELKDHYLAGGYVLLEIPEGQIAIEDATAPSPRTIIAVDKDFLEDYAIYTEETPLDVLLNDYSWETAICIWQKAELESKLGFEYRPQLDIPFVFPDECPSQVMLAFADFLSGLLQDQGYEDASKYLDALFEF